jgi:hypothetical protein
MSISSFKFDNAVLCSSSSAGVACGGITTVAGHTSKLFRKELIRVGRYVRADDGLDLRVDAEDLEQWALTFQRMKSNGVKVPIPSTHTDDPDRNNGWVEEMFVEGDGLIGILRLIGDSIGLAGKTDVSIYFTRDFTDGAGNKYTLPIRHVALCTNPVVPGLKEWEEITLSFQPKQDDDAMKIDLSKLQEGLGLSESTQLTEENVVDVLLSHNTELTKVRDGLQEKLKASEASLSTVRAEIERLTAPADKPNPVMVGLSLDNRKTKLDMLVKDGKLSPAARKQAEGLFCTEEAVSLSLTADPTQKTFNDFVALLSLNEIVDMQQHTAGQVVGLSHTQLSQSGNPGLMADMKARAEAEKK